MIASTSFVLFLLLGIEPLKATFFYWEYGTVAEPLPNKPKDLARFNSQCCTTDK